MRDHEKAMLSYVRLAEVSAKKSQPLGRDKLLVLAAAAACSAGWPDVAARCRQLILAHNPAHVIGNFPTVADALRSDDFAPLIRQLERLCGYERAEFLVGELGLENEPPGPGAKSAGERALALLSP